MPAAPKAQVFARNAKYEKAPRYRGALPYLTNFLALSLMPASQAEAVFTFQGYATCVVNLDKVPIRHFIDTGLRHGRHFVHPLLAVLDVSGKLPDIIAQAADLCNGRHA